MQSSLQRLLVQLEHGPQLYKLLPWDRYDYELMADEAKNIMNTSLHGHEQTEAFMIYEMAIERLQFMIRAEQEIAVCDPEYMSLPQLSHHLGKEYASCFENSDSSRWQAEAYAWAIVRAMNGRFSSKIKKPSYIVLCSQLVSSFQDGVRQELHTQNEKE